MTNEQLINLACKWLDYNSSRYIVTDWRPEPYVCGGMQTDLRAFLNSVKDMPDDMYTYYDAFDLIPNNPNAKKKDGKD